jgi:hypothetical protein
MFKENSAKNKRKTKDLPDAHDEVDHGDGVQVYAPEGHVSQDAQLDGDDGEGDPERAHGVGDEDDGYADHDDGGYDDALHRVR